MPEVLGAVGERADGRRRIYRGGGDLQRFNRLTGKLRPWWRVGSRRRGSLERNAVLLPCRAQRFSPVRQSVALRRRLEGARPAGPADRRSVAEVGCGTRLDAR